MATTTNPNEAQILVEALLGPALLAGLKPFQSFLAWVAANPNADKLQAMAQLNSLLAQEQVSLLQGGGQGAANLAVILNALATQFQNQVQAAVAAAVSSATAAPVAPAA